MFGRWRKWERVQAGNHGRDASLFLPGKSLPRSCKQRGLRHNYCITGVTCSLALPHSGVTEVADCLFRFSHLSPFLFLFFSFFLC